MGVSTPLACFHIIDMCGLCLKKYNNYKEKKMHYYLKNKNNEIVATVALVKSDGHWSRGISVRSKRDAPSKEIGRKIAGERATKAGELSTRTHVIFSASVYQSLIRRVRIADMEKLDRKELAFKALPDATLSDFEIHVLKRYHKMEI